MNQPLTRADREKIVADAKEQSAKRTSVLRKLAKLKRGPARSKTSEWIGKVLELATEAEEALR